MLTATLSEAVGVIVALLVAGFILFLLVRLWRWLVSVDLWQLRRDVLAVLFAVAAIATIIAQKDRIGDTGTTGVSPVVTELTNTLHFASIDVHTNGTATLTVAWPLELIPTNTTIDILAATSLVYSAWAWQCGHTVAEGETNWIETVSATGNLRFYKAVLRESLTDMDDPDGDGLPNAYELAHHRNPWLADSGTVPRLTVGEDGQFATLQSALAASDPYSVVAVTAGVYRVSAGIEVPHHPVMVTCEDGYAVFSGATPTGMFILADGHESGHTLFRNLYLNLASTSGMQAGFWCGGSLPWQGPGAAAVFENVHIRAPNPGVEYFGWLFYGHCEATAEIRGCNVNAAGAEWIYAIFGDNPPRIALESCTFVNFPTQGVYQSTAIGLRSTHANGAIPATPPVIVSRVLFDASFTNAWPMARFENAEDFLVTMTDCIRPSEPAAFDFTPNVTDNVHVVTSQVAWAGVPLPGSLEDVLGIGAFAPLPDDPDGDGLINLHEYWCGNHPLVPDGSNTLLSVASRAIDDRIWGVVPVTAIPRFTDFDPDAAVNLFTLNANFWARDLDLSCVSVWNSSDNPGGRTATLITRKHVVMARHWPATVYRFCDTNGVVLTRTVVANDDISDDLRPGRLNEPLPDSFKPASVMSTNYVRYLSTGKYLPTLCLNQEKGATVLELESLNCRVQENGETWHGQYGQNNMTNHVSAQRSNIRGATPGGNSGCPVFLVAGNELVLLFSKHLGSRTEDRWCRFSGPMLPFRLEAIQSKIDEWEGLDASQYQIDPIDFSSFGTIVNQ